MRRLAGLLLLALLFAGAALWQGWRVESLSEQREARKAAAQGLPPPRVTGELEDGWSAVVIGRPSGAEALPIEPEPELRPTGDGTGQGWEQQRAANLSDFTLEVRPGHTLTRIAQAHYGRCERDLIERLARYNGLRDPDLLEVGQRLALPPLDTLLSLDS